MVIGIDVRALARGTHSGVEEYVCQIVRALVEGFPEQEFRLWYNSRKRVPLDFSWLKRPNVRLVEGDLPNRLIDLTGICAGWPKADAILGGTDVFFSPHFFWTSMRRAPRVITFHDLSFLRYPEFYPLQKRLWHARMRLSRQIAGAAHVIAVSESTKGDLMSFFRFPQERITVIAEGVDRAEFAPMRASHPWLEAFRERNDLPGRFFLFVGTREPRKNLRGALAAFEQARRTNAIPKDVHFVIAGNPGWLYGDLVRFAKTGALAGFVHFRPVKYEERKFWYNAAEALVFPSFFEGFGLPPLEAMACGKPVITSNRSSLPEVAADAAILVDPFRPEETTAAMVAVLADGNLRDKLARRGLERAERFTWEEAAKKTFEVFEMVR